MVRLPCMVWFVVAAILHAAVGFMYLASGLMAPLYGIAILWAIWIACTVLLVRFRRRGPILLVVPIAAGLLWLGIMTLGDAFLGWTA